MGSVAFLFAGQGAQHPAMGVDLIETSPAAAEVFAIADEVRPGTSEQCRSASKEELSQTENTQPCVFVHDLAVAVALRERGEPAGRGTDTLHSSPTLVLPLKAPMRIRGVLVVAMPQHQGQGQVPGVEPRRLLQTCASLLAISLERIHYIDVAQKSTVQIESERLRNSLLSAISHDLRTPLASLVELPSGAKIAHVLAGKADRRVLLATSDGVGAALAVSRSHLDMGASLAWICAVVGILLLLEYGVLEPIKRELERWREAGA